MFKTLVLHEVHQLAATGSLRNVRLSRAQQVTLQMLQSQTKWVIRPADKGGAIVLQTREYYLTEALGQLSDVTTYSVLLQDPSIQLQATIKDLTQEALNNKLISKKEHRYLNMIDPRLAQFYTVPKIHKHATRPPGRPIVSTKGTLLEPLSTYLDSFLRPLLPEIPSYLRDTTHFFVSTKRPLMLG